MQKLNVLVVGSGGREHALVKALKASPSVNEVHAVPGSDGMSLEAKVHPAMKAEAEALSELCQNQKIGLVVVGPEVPLAEGLVDRLREKQILVFGPSQRAAKLEASKLFAKEFMVRAQMPTAQFKAVQSLDLAKRVLKEFHPPYVLKADGLAAGKGVYICSSESELELALQDLFVNKILGSASDTVLIEEFKRGYEISYLVLTNGNDFRALPLAQDHKRLKDNDLGPNTGGMGVVAPMKIDAHLDQEIRERILRPAISQLQNESFDYRGILYVGLMITADGPEVLEFNVRFGDPEAQVLLPLLDGDWAEVMLAVAKGELPHLHWKEQSSACVVLAAPGYPEKPQKGLKISGLPAAAGLAKQSYILHAGTAKNSAGEWETAGGRVLNVLGFGATQDEALRRAYEVVAKISWPGIQFRRDIGAKAVELSNKVVEHS